MNWKSKLERWGLDSLKLKTGFLEADFSMKDGDKEAAWKLYVELLTRITTQALPTGSGDEETALDSIYSLFATTRQVLKEQGRECVQFTKLAVIVLNQVVRPFTAEWHPKMLAGDLKKPQECLVFHEELVALQVELRKYSRALADLAEVEDLTDLEDVE
jgi:hypothetical protein